jgi:Pyruvate/2-oxoacid:ferredoxin oxidoreductase delta subunit
MTAQTFNPEVFHMPPKILLASKKSTRDFFREAKEIPGYSLFDRLHGYVYARWPYLYIGIAKRDLPLGKILATAVGFLGRFWPKTRENPDSVSFADTYHGKVVPTQAAAKLVSVNQNIRIDDLEQVIPYAKARAIVLKNPDHIAVLECPCRSSRADPCLPLDVCLVVGEPFASFIIEHHPQKARWVTSSEAIKILESERVRGHVSHAFFKDAMLERFYAICNCCKCCCGAMAAHRNGTPMLASSGYVAQVDITACLGCGDCKATCPFDAILVNENTAKIIFESCMGCGVCVEHCSQQALSLQRCKQKGIPLEIDELLRIPG